MRTEALVMRVGDSVVVSVEQDCVEQNGTEGVLRAVGLIYCAVNVFSIN